MKSLVWLASYPKSGNTWLRMFLTNYIVGAERPVPINQLEKYSTGDSLTALYRGSDGKDFDPGDDRKVLAIRTRVLRRLDSNGADINLLKTHNRNGTVLGHRLIPPELTRRAIYILRDPLDVVVSYADHYNIDTAHAARQMSDEATCTLPEATNVRQFLGSWSGHVASWTKKQKFPVTVLRYEDMLNDPEAAFAKVLSDMGAPVDPARLARAIRFSSFDEAARQEARTGFNEKSPSSRRFFRAGRAGTGRETLDAATIEKLCSDHGALMREFGYLT